MWKLYAMQPPVLGNGHARHGPCMLLSCKSRSRQGMKPKSISEAEMIGKYRVCVPNIGSNIRGKPTVQIDRPRQATLRGKQDPSTGAIAIPQRPDRNPARRSANPISMQHDTAESSCINRSYFYVDASSVNVSNGSTTNESPVCMSIPNCQAQLPHSAHVPN